MVAIQLHFLTGKLHATPWGRQVNEGAVEWPPSPWRLLRALISVWHNKFPDEAEENVESLIQLLSQPPEYRLPPTSEGHTRHYMPTDNKPAKIFDTFLVVPRLEPIVVRWPNAELDEPQRELLSRLVGGLGYFGRAESWVEAQLLESSDNECNARPLNDDGVGTAEQLERVLAPTEAGEFLNWRETAIQQASDVVLADKIAKAAAKDKPTDKLKLTAGDLKKVEATIPATIFQALHAETNSLRKAGWNRPPGSRWVEYVRPARVNTASTRSNARPKQSLPTVARYAVTGRVVPRLTDALRIGERARQFLMGCSKRANKNCGLEENASSVFSGKNTDGSPLKLDTPHQHAHFLCEAAGDSAKITHLTVYAPMGFSAADEAALARLTRTWGDGGHDLQFVLLGIGQPRDFGGTNDKAGQSITLASSKHWVSRTPFVLSRHLKVKRSEKSDVNALRRELEKAVRFELSSRQIIDSGNPVTIEPILDEACMGTILGGTKTSWLKFARERKQGHGSKAGSHGYGFRLKFESEIAGPIALGYGCHFGLGQFTADCAGV